MTEITTERIERLKGQAPPSVGSVAWRRCIETHAKLAFDDSFDDGLTTYNAHVLRCLVADADAREARRLEPFQRFGEWAGVFAELEDKGWRVPGSTAFRDRPSMDKDEIYLSGKDARIVMRGIQGNLVVTISDGATLADFWPTLARLEAMRDAALKAGETR